jgi:hypothetical protein
MLHPVLAGISYHESRNFLQKHFNFKQSKNPIFLAKQLHDQLILGKKYITNAMWNRGAFDR